MNQTPKEWLALSAKEILAAFEFKLIKYNQKIDRAILIQALKGLRKSEIYKIYIDCLCEPFFTMGILIKSAEKMNAQINAPFLERAKQYARLLETKVARCCEDKISGCAPQGFTQNEMKVLEKVFGDWRGVVENFYYYSQNRDLFCAELESEIFTLLKNTERTPKKPISTSTNENICVTTSVAEAEPKVEVEPKTESAQTKVIVAKLITQTAQAVSANNVFFAKKQAPPHLVAKVDTG